MADPQTPLPPPVVPSPPKNKPTLRRIFVACALLFVAFLVTFVVAVPYIVSGDFVRKGIERDLSGQLNTRVQIASHDFSWFSGLEIRELQVANPAGFPADRQALQFARLAGDVSIFSLLKGEVGLKGEIDGLEVRLYEKADGSTNFGALLAKLGGGQAPGAPSPDPKTPKPGTEPPADLSRIDVDLRIKNSLIEIEHEKRGVLESLQKVETGARKLRGSSAVRLFFNADLVRDGAKSGRVDFTADVDANPAVPATMVFTAEGLDLSRYRALLHSFLDPKDHPEAFEGVLGGKIEGEYQHGKSATLAGDLTLVKPKFAGALFQGMTLTADRWTFRPKIAAKLDAELRVQSLSTEGFAIELGFFSLTGLAPAAATKFAQGKPAAGFAYQVDLRKLADMGLAPLAGLRGGQGSVSGTATVTTDVDLTTAPAALAKRWSDFVRAEVAWMIDGLQQSGFDIRKFGGDIVVDGGKLTLQSKPGGTVNGGPLTMSARSDIADLLAAQAEVKLQWKGGQVDGDAVRWLRYAVPLLDGLPVENVQGLDLRSKIDVDLTLVGPVLRREEESGLSWMNRWKGQGQLAMVDGGFSPAPVWKTVLEFAGLSTPLAFRSIDSKFRFQDGGVATELMKFNKAASSWSLSGTVDVQGRIDYGIDLKQLLKGRKDGERVLKYLNDQPIQARLTGTLDAPSLAAPSYEDLAKQALAGAAKGAVEGLLDEKTKKKVPKGILDLFKKKL